jgi:NADPH:quinone reductase-like Zn-dependent oxidoreductase
VKAISRNRYCRPEELELIELDKPVPKTGEVLVRLHSTALNASDVELLTGRPAYSRVFGLFKPRFAILGSDIAGVVDAVGPNVERFSPGDAVYGDIFETFGALAEWVCAPEDKLRSKPAAMSFDEAAALPQSGTIALQALQDKADVKPGQKVLINGAAGGGGSFAIQIAKALGAEVTAVDSAEKQEVMRALGADSVLDYAQDDCTRADDRYDAILDLVGHHSVLDFRRILAPRGRYYLVGGPMGLVLGTLTLGSLLSLFSGKKMRLLALKTNQGLSDLEEKIASGRIAPHIDRIFPLERSPEALRYLADGHAKGKVIIRNCAHA